MANSILGIKMKLNIILDSRRIEKYQPLMDELSRQGIADYEIWPALILPDVIESISASHKAIIRDAKEKGLKEICIAEDDVYFPAADGWQYFLKNKPEDYELYLAASYGGYSEKQPIGFHLYCIHEQFYDKLLSIPDNCHIDTGTWWLGKEKFVFCYPFAALQRPGFSANNMSHADYNKILKPEDVYGGLP